MIKATKLLNRNKEDIINTATYVPYKGYINHNPEFHEEVLQDGAMDKDYFEASKSLRKEREKSESTLFQEEGMLYRKVYVWVPCGLQDTIL
jgi:hypothetical protein